MKKYLPLIFSLFVFSACDALTNSASNSYTNVDTAAAGELMYSNQQNSDFVILDVRTAGEVAQGKIPGSINIDITQAGFTSQLKQLDPNKTYLVYCKSGGRSSKAAGQMVGLGFKNVYNLSSGFLGGIPQPTAPKMPAAEPTMPVAEPVPAG